MNRLDNIDKFLRQIKTQKEWEKEKKINVDNILNKYKGELEDYKLVKNVKEFNMLKLGGYIRYVDSNDDLKWGGILLKKIINNNIYKMILCNSSMDRYIISFHTNTIFYKKHTTASDKTRKFFVSLLEKDYD